MLSFSAQTRAANLARMAEGRFDVLVIGGGITGVGIALDAAAHAGLDMRHLRDQVHAGDPVHAGQIKNDRPRVRLGTTAHTRATPQGITAIRVSEAQVIRAATSPVDAG